MLLGIAAILWSACTGVSALATNFWLLLVPRFGLGIFESACNPPAYSLIADYFPPDMRTRANSIYSFGIYIGGGLSSLTTVLEGVLGTWQATYVVIAAIGGGFGVLCVLFVLEPKRGRFDDAQQRGTAVIKPTLA